MAAIVSLTSEETQLIFTDITGSEYSVVLNTDNFFKTKGEVYTDKILVTNNSTVVGILHINKGEDEDTIMKEIFTNIKNLQDIVKITIVRGDYHMELLSQSKITVDYNIEITTELIERITCMIY